MPVGTGFENSAMKTSFSLSSLQPPETPDRVVKVRACNSLTKKKRGEEYWRRSWGSTAGSTASDQKDDFWSALQANYDYIMDNQLIDNCKEANGELTTDARMWSLKEFYIQYSDLYSWLNSVQETLETELANSEDSLRTHYVSEVAKKNSLLRLFNEQASQLVQLHPEMEEDVTWRVIRLNSKWEAMEVGLGPSGCKNCTLHTCTDIEHELKRLRTWMKNAESRLQPLDFRVKWSEAEIENKILEHKVLHRDIESYGKQVSAVVKLCKGRNDVSDEGVNIKRVSRNLERRWHLLFLRSLEWQCYIDSLSKGLAGKSHTALTESSDSENDDEPLSKYPRLGDVVSKNPWRRANTEEICVDVTDGTDFTMVKPKIDDKNNMKKDLTYYSPERIKCTEDTSHFTKSNRRAPNFGTYYFKHEDTTDSEVQTLNSSKMKPQTALEDSSEDEWIYSDRKQQPEKKLEDLGATSENAPPSKSPCQDIRRLVQKAEELVRESPVKRIKSSTGAPLSKMSRVKQWLNMDKRNDSCHRSSMDSCDASCEEEEKESQSSEDLNESVATCRALEVSSRSLSVVEVEKAGTAPKVPMRHKRADLKRNRPWSISCISQLPYTSSRSGKSQSLSNSESALHQLHQLPLSPKYSKSLTASANSISLYQNNSTSSTMEEGGTILVEHNSTPVRRRRLKFRRKSSSRKRSNESKPRERSGTLIKSGSFSGSSYKVTSIERNTASDPSTINYGLYILYHTSDAESDDDRQNKGMPIFRIGEATNYLSADVRDNSPGKSSITNTEEQSSSLSEQAWDSYQEKYLSEAYSEAQDSDAARRLLEFGEDYRNFLDSQSDWSAQSTNPEFSPPFKRKILTPFEVMESESDSEDVRHLLKQSRNELLHMAQLYNKQFATGFSKCGSTNDSVIIATCDRYLYCLNLMEKSPEEYFLSKIYRDQTGDLLSQWKRLKEKTNRMQEYRNLQKEILVLKDELHKFKTPAPFDSLVVNSIDEVCKEIDAYTEKLVDVEERKAKLLTLNVAVHRFVIENKTYNSSALKTDINELYRMWYDVHNSVTERLNHLKCLLQTWQALESRLEQLKGDLEEDKENLAVLDSAVRDGALSDQIAASVREVAKVLSETNQGSSLPGLLSESSLSDSGISDEGSEHEHGERERRLASIRHLMRQLESIMAPNSFARATMNERFSATEDELRDLQKRCRSLVVRTAVVSAAIPGEQTSNAVTPDSGDPDDKPGAGSWFKRFARASLSFHLAIVALACVAFLLEPHCCDNMNTFSMSLTPQLRYVRGPPPV